MTMRPVLTFLALALLLAAAPASAADIHDAVKAGDAAAVRAIVEKDPARLNARDETGRTPLHWAALGTSAEILEYLVERGADLGAVDTNGQAAVHILARDGKLPGLKLVLDKGADADLPLPDKKTALHVAAMTRRHDVLRLLAARGAALETRDDRGRTPLVHSARQLAGVEVVRTLLDLGADVNSADGDGETALTLAAWRGSGDVVDLLLERKASLPTDPQVVRNAVDSTVSQGLAGLFARLSDRGVDVTQEDQLGRTFLHRAAEGGSTAILETLAAKGLAIGQQDGFGWAPLHFAADLARTAAIEWLIAKGADRDARTSMGQSAYNIAEDNGDRETMDFLAARGFDRSPAKFPERSGPYLGRTPPDKTRARLFAPGIVSARYGLHSSPAFSPDGTEVYWTVMIPARKAAYGGNRTLVSRLENGRWTYPKEAVFDGVPLGDVPFISPDGSKLFDVSSRRYPDGRVTGKENIWTWDKGSDGWTNPRPLSPAVNDLPQHWEVSVDREGNLYFASTVADSLGGRDIYVSRLVDGRHGTPENLGAPVNSPGMEEFPFIAPDGRYLLFGRGMDIFVSFREKDGRWGEPRPLGPEVNTPDLENLPVVSPDGRYLFFSRYQMIFWIDAAVIEDARPASRTTR